MIPFLCSCLLLAQTPSPPAAARPPLKIGLALSGGAALGLAHIGVLKVLEQEGIPISAVSGNSMGSVVGGLYAAGYTARQLDSLARALDWERLFDDRLPYSLMTLDEREAEHRYQFTVPRRGFLPDLPSGILQLQNIEIFLKGLLSQVEYNTAYDFDSLPIPFRAVAVDLETGEKTVFRSGSLAEAIRASAAIPIIFTPAVVNRRLYVDGGVVQDLPVEPVKELSPDFIIAVDVGKRSLKTPSLIDIIIRTSTIATEKDRHEQRSLADIVIFPDLENFVHSDFVKAPELIKRGEAGARAALPELRRLLRGRTLANPRHPVSPRPLPFIRTITIQGLTTTRPATIRREIKTQPGSLLDFPELVADLERLHHTGLFSHVDYALDFPAPETVDIEFTCSERNFGTYSLGGCFDNTYGIRIGSEIAHDNILGSGLKLALGGSIQNPLRAWADVSGARLLFLPFTYRLAGSFEKTEHKFYQDGRWVWNYIDQVWGAGFKAGLNIENSGYLKFGLDVRSVSYRFLTNDPPPGEDSTDRLITPSVELKFNSYKNLLFPAEGTFFLGRVAYGSRTLGSDHDFLTFELATKNGFKFIGPIYLEPSLGAGFTVGKSPLIERFKTGNPDFTGYSVDEFITDQRLTAGLAGRAFLFHLFGSKNYPLYFELAANLGTLLPFREMTSWPTVRDSLLAGASVGFRTNTPVGSLLFKVGFNRQYKRTFYLSIGDNPVGM